MGDGVGGNEIGNGALYRGCWWAELPNWPCHACNSGGKRHGNGSLICRIPKQLSRIRSLFWVGAFGAAVAQINILVSRFLAYSLDDQGALPYLFLSARLIELPLGVFAIAISTVLFSRIGQEVPFRPMIGDSKKSSLGGFV